MRKDVPNALKQPGCEWISSMIYALKLLLVGRRWRSIIAIESVVQEDQYNSTSRKHSVSGVNRYIKLAAGLQTCVAQRTNKDDLPY